MPIQHKTAFLRQRIKTGQPPDRRGKKPPMRRFRCWSKNAADSLGTTTRSTRLSVVVATYCFEANFWLPSPACGGIRPVSTVSTTRDVRYAAQTIRIAVMGCPLRPRKGRAIAGRRAEYRGAKSRAQIPIVGQHVAIGRTAVMRDQPRHCTRTKAVFRRDDARS